MHEFLQSLLISVRSDAEERGFTTIIIIFVGTESQFIPQYKLENTKLPKFMLLHFGRTRLIWDWLILLIVAYIAITVPFNVAFKVHNFSLLIIDLSIEFLFICDIGVNFRTTFIESKTGKLITNPRDIAKNYFRGWLVVDCLAALPFELLYFFNPSLFSHIALLKTSRLLRLFRVGRRVSRYIEYTATLLILMMFSFALLAHWFACIWYVIGYEELHNGKSTGWLYELGNQVGKPFMNESKSSLLSSGEQYISALYFIFTSLTTVGFGNIAPNTVAEKTFCVLVLLLGAIVQSAIFGNMTAVIQKLYAARARFHAKASQIKQFVRHHQIDGELRRRIEDWFISHWSISKGVNTDEMLESFPSELQADICSHLYRSFLTLPCFMHASRGCLRSISLKVNKAYYSPGELVIKEKDAINALFFVQRGTIEIVQRDFIVAILGTGDLFGEDISKSKPAKRSNGDVRALMYCDILYLTRESIKEVLLNYPDFCDQFGQSIGLSFDLATRRSSTGANNAAGLGSIVEETECVTHTSSSSSNSSSEESDVSNNRRQSMNKKSLKNRIPLWQRKLRHQDSEINDSPNSRLKNRLMQIESSGSENEAVGTTTPNRKMSETSFSDSFGRPSLIENIATAVLKNSISVDKFEAILELEHTIGQQETKSIAVDSYPRRVPRRANSDRKIRPKLYPEYLHSQSENTHGRDGSYNWLDHNITTDDNYLHGVVIGNAMYEDSSCESKQSLIHSFKSSSKSLPTSPLNINVRRDISGTSTTKVCHENIADYLSVPNTEDQSDGSNQPLLEQNNTEMNVLDFDQGIYSQCSDSGSHESCRRWIKHEAPVTVDINTNFHHSNKQQNKYDQVNTDDVIHIENYHAHTSDKDLLKSSNSNVNLDIGDNDHAWSHLATELVNLKKGDMQEMKDEMVELRNEIRMIKKGMDSLTELVRTALLKSTNQCT